MVISIKKILRISYILLLCTSALVFLCTGCSVIKGYSNESLFPEDIESVRLEMFDNQTFRRGIENDLSEALSKKIETDTPYKIISSYDRADSVLSGLITSVQESVLSTEYQTGHALEKEVQLHATINWKNLKTGELLIDHRTISASSTYSEYQAQDFGYASKIAANNLARKIVEQMEKKW